jgi:hypothetical protein
MDTLMVIHFRNVGQLESFINFLRNKVANGNTPPEERRALRALIPQLQNILEQRLRRERGAHPN